MTKDYFRVSKNSYNANILGNKMVFSEYVLVNLSAGRLEGDGRYSAGIKKGDRVRVVKGRKIPVGTEATVKGISTRYSDTFYSSVTGEHIHYNPSLLLILDDGSEVWTSGKNCINITDTGLEGILELNPSEEDATRKALRERDNNDRGAVWYKDTDGMIYCTSLTSFWGFSTKSYSVYQDYIKETENEIVAVIDDFVTDTYKCVRFSKNVEHNNLVEIVDTGSARNMDDMWRGDTGLEDALKAFAA